MVISRPTMKSHPFKNSFIFSSKHHHLNQLCSLGCAQSFGRLELHIKLHVKFPRSGANLRLADEKARERIGVDAVRGVGPLRMVRRKMNRTAPAAGLGTGWLRGSRGHQGCHRGCR